MKKSMLLLLAALSLTSLRADALSKPTLLTKTTVKARQAKKLISAILIFQSTPSVNITKSMVKFMNASGSITTATFASPMTGGGFSAGATVLAGIGDLITVTVSGTNYSSSATVSLQNYQSNQVIMFVF